MSNLRLVPVDDLTYIMKNVDGANPVLAYYLLNNALGRLIGGEDASNALLRAMKDYANQQMAKLDPTFNADLDDTLLDLGFTSPCDGDENV